MKLAAYRLADLSHTVPMPDRGFRLFAQSEEGETIDVEHPFYRTMIADGDLVPVKKAAKPKKE